MVAVLAWYDNPCEDDTDGVPALGVSGGTATFDSAHPGSRMLNADPYDYTRIQWVGSAGTGALTVTVQWSTTANDRNVRIVKVENCRIPATRLDNVLARCIAFGGGTLATSGSITQASLDPVPGETDVYNLTFYFTSTTACAGVAIVFTFATATVFNDYLDIGLIDAPEKHLVLNGVGRTFSYETVDESPVSRSPGGSVSADPYPTRARIHIPIVADTYANMIGTLGSSATASLRKFIAESGKARRVIVVPQTSDVHSMQALAMYGHIVNDPTIDGLGGNYFATSEIVVEQRR